MKNSSFPQLYKSLNKEQREAVDSIEGPVMVVAGPGTGKTQILTLRIANILKKTDTDPDSILALTFTESAVYSMRKRLSEIIGSDAYRVNIFTFHGFCNTIIKEYIEYFPKMVGFVPALESDQIEIIESILEEKDFEKFKKLPSGISRKDTVVGEIKSSISTLKRENISVKDFKKTILKREKVFYSNPDLLSEKKEGKIKTKYASEESQIIKNKELAEIYKLYEEKLEEFGLYDYDDMIVSVVENIKKNKKLLSILQEQYQYILVDEHQDTNSAQNKVVELISGFYEEPNLFIVGDEKQAIFRFQGADLNNFLYFKKIYPNVKIINLQKNYRSNQIILDSAHSLISKSEDGMDDLRVELKSAREVKSEKINLYEFNEEGVEYEFISESIKKKIDSGFNPAEIAILVRKNRDIDGIARFLGIAGVPFMIDSEEDILSDNDIKKLIKIFKAIEYFDKDDILSEALYVDLWDIPAIDIYEVWKSARGKDGALIKIINSPKARKSLDIDDSSKEKLEQFVNKIMSWRKLSRNVGLADLFAKVVSESGILGSLMSSSESIEKIEKINVLFDELKNLVERNRRAGLKDFIKYIELLESKQISVKRKIFGNADLPRVRLMTAHRSKGREFDCVYIANAYDGHWGNLRGRNGIKLLISDSGDKNNDDERRLFYVALTRARNEINISYAKLSSDGKNRLPTSFISDINPDLINTGDIEPWEKSFNMNRQKLLISGNTKTAPLKDKAYLNAKFIEYGLSVSALNNYLECPWKYFYNNLVRIPTAENVYALYGQAIHYALENYFKKFKLGESATKEDLISFFIKSLESKPLSEKEFKTQKERGIESLSGYFDEYSHEWGKYPFLNEFSIRGVLLDEFTKINGKIDKLDILNENNDVRVIDFKTSDPKSRNDIEGRAGDKSGDMKRQLVFYKLLLNKYENGKYKMTDAVIDFVQPNNSGKYKREQFVVSDEEVEALESQVKSVAKEIFDLTFWNNRCDRKDCEYCSLRDMTN